MGFIARVLGTFGGQAAGPATFLPTNTAPTNTAPTNTAPADAAPAATALRRAISTPVLARSPIRPGSIFARFSSRAGGYELPTFRDRRGRIPSAAASQQTIEQLAPRLQSFAGQATGLRARLSELEAKLAIEGGGTGSRSPTSGRLQTPADAHQAQQLDQQLQRLGRFGQAIGELAALRLQLDAGLTGGLTTGQSGGP